MCSSGRIGLGVLVAVALAAPLVAQTVVGVTKIPQAIATTSFTPTDDTVLVGNGAAFQNKALTDCQGTGAAVTYTASSNAFGCNTLASLAANTFTDDQTLANGKALKGDTTTAHTWKLQAYDNNTGPAYVTFATFTNGNTPSLAIAPPSGGSTISINTTTLAGLGISACPMGQTAAITLSTDDTGNILFTRGSCS